MDNLNSVDSERCDIGASVKLKSSGQSAQKGAVLVEFCFVLVFFLVMLFGIIQYSIIMSTMSQLQETTREGLRFYTVHFSDPNDTNDTIAYMQTESAGSFLQNNDITVNSVTITPVTSGLVGDGNPYTLTFSYNLHKRVFFSGFVPGVATLNNDTVVKSATGIVEQ